MCKKNDFFSLTKWADINYQMYKTRKALSSYFARNNNRPLFYILNYGVGDYNCKELPYEQYMEMDLNNELIEISADEVKDDLIKSFYAYINQMKG